MVREAHVVICTTVGSSSDYLKGLNFNRVIMDDSNKISEIDSIIPLLKGCQQLVLVGD